MVAGLTPLGVRTPRAEKNSLSRVLTLKEGVRSSSSPLFGRRGSANAESFD
jgi:hypothetical protein